MPSGIFCLMIVGKGPALWKGGGEERASEVVLKCGMFIPVRYYSWVR